jgi:hypothetical protein
MSHAESMSAVELSHTAERLKGKKMFYRCRGGEKCKVACNCQHPKPHELITGQDKVENCDLKSFGDCGCKETKKEVINK